MITKKHPHPDRRQEIYDRIMKRVEIRDCGHRVNGVVSPCHVWTGPTSGEGRGGGYGRISINSQTCATHIVVATHYFGYIPSNKQVDHGCRNRLCCNPEHLELVSQRENCRRRDKALKEEKS
ncbi:HNH endonuclease [Salmonella enterica]|nr:HNH endonuclease [Salmonella enterica]